MGRAIQEISSIDAASLALADRHDSETVRNTFLYALNVQGTLSVPASCQSIPICLRACLTRFEEAGKRLEAVGVDDFIDK